MDVEQLPDQLKAAASTGAVQKVGNLTSQYGPLVLIEAKSIAENFAP